MKISVGSFFDELDKIAACTKQAAWYHRVGANVVGLGGHAAEAVGSPAARKAYAKAAKLYKIDSTQLAGKITARGGKAPKVGEEYMTATPTHVRWEKSKGKQQDWADKAATHKQYGGSPIWATD